MAKVGNTSDMLLKICQLMRFDRTVMHNFVLAESFEFNEINNAYRDPTPYRHNFASSHRGGRLVVAPSAWQAYFTMVLSTKVVQAGLSNLVFVDSISQIAHMASATVAVAPCFVEHGAPTIGVASHMLRWRPIVLKPSIFRHGLGASSRHSP
jgi:hypothetical protein